MLVLANAGDDHDRRDHRHHAAARRLTIITMVVTMVNSAVAGPRHQRDR
jgi:hypothetical protein